MPSRGAVKPETHDRKLAAALCGWFTGHARELPWRTLPRDPYASLVSEIMLQQTQVSRVVERFGEFLGRFPTVADLAAAPEGEVLALWSGLGYYRRARNLHAAARQIEAEFGGRMPETVPGLLALPGVGRYTAGAIASIAFGQRVPIVDGNVARVLLRLDGRPLAHGSPAAQRWAWRRAEHLVNAAPDPGAFNEGLMELGATVCTPRNPDCGRCPWRRACIAHARGLQDRIPRAKQAAARRVIHCSAAVLTDGKGRVLLERRPDGGMWAGLWQAPTIESPAPIARPRMCRWLGIDNLRASGSFAHQTSHREVRFKVYRGNVSRDDARALASRSLAARADLAGLGLGSAQRRVILLGIGESGGLAEGTPPSRASDPSAPCACP